MPHILHEDRWLTAIFGYPVFKIDGASHSPAETIALLQEHASQQSEAFYYAKVDTTQVELVRRFSIAGMYVVDVNTTFRLDPPYHAGNSPAHIEVVHVQPQYADEVLRIAGSCFRYSRFHLDPCIPGEVAHRIKRAWIENYILGKRGSALLVALLNGQIAGFLAVLDPEGDGRQVRTIDLVGVDSACQGRRVGETLVNAFIAECGAESEFLQVGTQAANIPSVRLYEKLGFRMASASYVLHMHVDRDYSR